ncbi:SAM-dependent methyltransferase [Tepidibacillus infernus]|uniref:class I SAM-dependent methyltransferase n=1 Tax=Tepidibacillus TaxID=1494427 RepID=UPI000852E087|nr:SAM-dependent methyltransferase [Tepidibacillus sp. HK-1]GBF12614.1 hypothetical protein HK1_02681 [Tepidibacillus sp. HK-1]
MKEANETQLSKEIIKMINDSPEKRITFYDFMKMALYAPELGYYTKDRKKIGKSADFYTSSSVGPIFGQTIANSFVELLQYASEKETFFILEMGGGDGRFARDVLNAMFEKYPKIYQSLTYFMLEASPYHQDLQREHLERHLNHVKWIDQLQDLPQPFIGIIFSNELVDSFPVHKVKKVNGKFKEIFVTWNEERESYEEITAELSHPSLEDYFIQQKVTLKEGQVAEINLDAMDWMKHVAQRLIRGYVITIDYGYPADELYASHRHDGTLMCYYQHTANDNPYQLIGEQDITTHVNFTALMEEGKRWGLEPVWFSTQSHFLMNSGILEMLQEIGLDQMKNKDLFQDEAIKLNRAIRQLIMPGEMGETFKVLVQQKNMGSYQYRFMTSALKQYGL